MSDSSPATLAAARQLWERFAGQSTGRDDAMSAADRVLTELDIGLRRWIGAEGYATLLKRAVLLTLAEQPALHSIPDLAVDLSASTNGRVYSSAEVAEAMVALLATLMQLLGRIIGEEMAARLVGHIGGPSMRNAGSLRKPVLNDDI